MAPKRQLSRRQLMVTLTLAVLITAGALWVFVLLALLRLGFGWTFLIGLAAMVAFLYGANGIRNDVQRLRGTRPGVYRRRR